MTGLSYNKLFITSLPRCATVSMCHALALFGVPMSHLGRSYRWQADPGSLAGEHHEPRAFLALHEQLTAGDYGLHCLNDCRGLADYPACCLKHLRKLDAQYPGSLFVHVARDANVAGWLQSTERQLVGLDLLDANEPDPLRRQFMQVMRQYRNETFGSPVFDAAIYEQAYFDYQREIASWSQTEPERWLLFHDVSELRVSGLSRLARFLEYELPEDQLLDSEWPNGGSFPHVEEHGSAAAAAFYRGLRSGQIRSQTGIS